MSQQDLEKKVAARKSVELVEPGMTVGLGSGSTSAVMVHLLGERVRAGLELKGAVPTSTATRDIAISYGIPILTLDEAGALDLTIDGADEADRDLALIKGGGGALLHEKIVAAASERFVVIVDSSKLVDALGAFKLPVEVVPFAKTPVRAQLQEMGAEVTTRSGAGGAPFITEEGNLIFDCDFGPISNPRRVADALSRIPGLVEHGLFVDMTDLLIVGRGEEAEAHAREDGD